PLVLRHAGPETDLVAVLLLDLEPHVHAPLDVRRLLDVDGLTLEGLEVAELIDAPDAGLQRLGVEDTFLEQHQLAAHDLVSRMRVPGDRDPVDEVLPAL